MTADVTYRDLLRDVLKRGEPSSPRGKDTLEIMMHTTCVSMLFPVVVSTKRKLSARFMASEALWILTGSNRVDFNEHIQRNWARFSDDGITLNGAYGPMFVEQYRYVVDKLKQDRDSRQAVMTLWRPMPRDSKDIPCTVALQFLIRDSQLHLNVFMRSSDCWLGWPYDVFTFTMMANYVGLCLKTAYPDLIIGNLRLTAGSQHLYAEHNNLALCVVNDEDILEYDAMTLSRHNHPGDLLAYLRCAIDDPSKLFP